METPQIATIKAEGFTSILYYDGTRGFFHGDADIDADGANGQRGKTPAYKADDSGSELLANGGMGRTGKGRVICLEDWARDIVICGEDRQPKIFPGGLIASKTAYRFPHFAPDDPKAYLDSETVEYIVLPGIGFTGHDDVKIGPPVLGCAARVTFNGRSFDCLVGDKGPWKVGEISIALARHMGIRSNPRNGGIEKPEIFYEYFPGQHGKIDGKPVPLQYLNGRYLYPN